MTDQLVVGHAVVSVQENVLPPCAGEHLAYDPACQTARISYASRTKPLTRTAWRLSMSSSERHRRSRRVRTLCAACQERKARFKYRGEVRADRDHTLCFECYRGEINRARARRLSELIPSPPMVSPFGHPEVVGGRILDERQIAHRQLMLDYLRRPPAVAS